MIQNIIRTLGGIDRYGTVSLCLFGFIFAAVLVWAMSQRKGHLDRMARVPLESEDNDHNNGGVSHE